MPRFAANVGDNWLYKEHKTIFQRIEAAHKDGFNYIECGNPYNYDPHKIKQCLDKYNMKMVLINTNAIKPTKKHRRFHAIYADEQNLFLQSFKRALDYAKILECPNIHIDTGVLTDDTSESNARNTLIKNLGMVQNIMDKDCSTINLLIEPVSNLKECGIENYFLWSQLEAKNIIHIVNNDYNGKYPIRLQYDLYHSQIHFGNVTNFILNNINIIGYIQVSQYPNRDEPCDGKTTGELNYNFIFEILDNNYDGFVGLEYHPKYQTSDGLKMDDGWFQRWNINENNAIKIVDNLLFMIEPETVCNKIMDKPKIPNVMKAMIIDENTKKLVLDDSYPVPVLQSGQVLIEIKASAVNRADLLQAGGRYAPPKGASDIIGLECSGIIVDFHSDCKLVSGTNNKLFCNGSRVMTLLIGGGYGKYATVDERHLIPLPEQYSFVMGAAIPEAWLTAFQILFWVGNAPRDRSSGDSNELKSNESESPFVVLVHAGGSGVGTALVQICREFNLDAYVTAGSQKKIDFCLHLGAKAGCNYKQNEFDIDLRKIYENGANLVLDCVGSNYWYKNMDVLAMDGVLVSYGFLSGPIVKCLDETKAEFSIANFLRKRISVCGTTLRSRSNQYKSELISDFTKSVVQPLLINDKIGPIINKEFRMCEAQEAHDYVRDNKNIGKVVLVWEEDVDIKL